MRTLVACLLLGLLAFPPPILAWNAAGHGIIASLAFRRLSLAEQARVVAILQRHPRFTQDFEEAMPAEVQAGSLSAQHEWLFQQAAIWPDLVRDGPPAKTAFHRPTWHYINVPLFPSVAARDQLAGKLQLNLSPDIPVGATVGFQELNVAQAIKFGRRVVGNKLQERPEDRAVMLAWLLHAIGDIHQPLHATTYFSPRLFPEGDRGRNNITLKEMRNLHAQWDSFPSEGNERESRNQALLLLSSCATRTVGEAAGKELNEQAWLKESYGLAKAHVYSPEVMNALEAAEREGKWVPITLTESYLKKGGAVADTRVVEAGFRLGAVLKELIAAE